MTPSADNQQEPSMEEILASIRKIIAENGEEGSKPTAQANSPDKAGQSTPRERILELTNVVGEETSAPAEERTHQQSQRQPSRSGRPQSQQQRQSQEQSFRPASSSSNPEKQSSRDDMVKDNDLEKELSDLPLSTAPALTQTQLNPISDQSVTLMSHETAVAASAAFAELATVSRLPVGRSSDRTLEDLTKDILRPLLKTWLDQNLPPLVERLIRQEIERIVRNRS
ncbi:MAG: DUF2497 domain-containing protein [Alphaproteobacteria bacterium]